MARGPSYRLRAPWDRRRAFRRAVARAEGVRRSRYAESGRWGVRRLYRRLDRRGPSWGALGRCRTREVGGVQVVWGPCRRPLIRRRRARRNAGVWREGSRQAPLVPGGHQVRREDAPGCLAGREVRRQVGAGMAGSAGLEEGGILGPVSATRRTPAAQLAGSTAGSAACTRQLWDSGAAAPCTLLHQLGVTDARPSRATAGPLVAGCSPRQSSPAARSLAGSCILAGSCRPGILVAAAGPAGQSIPAHGSRRRRSRSSRMGWARTSRPELRPRRRIRACQLQPRLLGTGVSARRYRGERCEV